MISNFTPEFLNFMTYFAIWDTICIGVCLPLITIKLLWPSVVRTIRKLDDNNLD
jgi:hypothetical protein